MTIINTNSSNRTYTISGLINGQTYKVRVAAVNSVGQGQFTQYVEATPSLVAIDDHFYNVELLMDMDQTIGSDNYYGNSALILSTSGFDSNNDQYSVQTKLLLHGDGIAITDSSLNPKSITRVNNPYTVSDSRFGTGSIRFSGNDYLTMGSSNDFNVGTGDFTVELFIKFKSINTHNPICNPTNNPDSADSGKWFINYNTTNGLYFHQHSTSNISATPWSPSIDTWYHVAVIRNSGTIKMFIDGIEQSVSNATAFSATNFNQSGFSVGRIASTGGLDAQIDEFRFTKGVARNITVPTTAYPNPTNPFADLSSSSKNIIVIGQPSAASHNTAPSVAPTNIIPSQPQSGSLRLDWDLVFPLVVDFIVQYSADGGINWVTVNDGVSTNNHVTINNLANGFYIFRIAATNSLGQGPWSEQKDITLPLPASVEYLVVAGGGGGGNDMGGGGGAGGLITNVNGASSGGGSTAESVLFLENFNTINVVVGGGGSGAAAGSGGAGTNGGNSTISSDFGALVTAIGGGFGASKHDSNSWNANNGGSGGGGSGGRQSSGSYGGLPGNGTAKQGYNGAGSGPTWYPGGGGGAGGAGIGNGSVRGHGGPGVLSRILGTAYYWAGGGGGSGYSTTGGDGGIGGGGGGAVGTTVGGAGINNGSAGGGGNTNSQTNTPGGNGGTNTGGGGGGGSHYNSNNYGGSGGSGAVILRSLATASSTTGSPTVLTDGQYNIYMFTGTGSITFASTPSVPPPPKNITNTQNSQGDLLLSWDAISSSYNITSYSVQYRVVGDTNWTTINNISSNSTTINSLAVGDYVVRVAAVNSLGQGPWRAAFVTISYVVDVQYLVVAGGGGGGNGTGGGGGGGGYISGAQPFNKGVVMPVVVGAGGSSVGNRENGTSGTASSLNTSISAVGGGYGAGYNGNPEGGGSGGSGGGGANGNNRTANGSGTVGQGFAGGVGGGSEPGGGGGGGASSVGGAASVGGGGGNGTQWINGVTYAGGGGAGFAYYYSGYGGPGGSGGGGSGGSFFGPTASAGSQNTGGGGGGSGWDNWGQSGSSGAGGSGIVILRTLATAASTTGNPTVTQDGNYNIYTFTGTGSITF